MHNYQLARLRIAYQLYIEAATNQLDVEAAKDMADGFIKYITACQEDYSNWDLESAVDNQIRMLYGLAECYRKVVTVDAVTEKTRWSL